jgi:hypothetical protein
MKRLLSMLALSVAFAVLSGCYYDPGYTYVRSGAGGDAYYGAAVAPAYYGDYGYGYGFDGFGYGYGYGCCYGPAFGLGFSSIFIDSRGFRHYYNRGYGGYGYRGGYRGGYYGGRPGYRGGGGAGHGSWGGHGGGSGGHGGGSR